MPENQRTKSVDSNVIYHVQPGHEDDFGRALGKETAEAPLSSIQTVFNEGSTEAQDLMVRVLSQDLGQLLQFPNQHEFVELRELVSHMKTQLQDEEMITKLVALTDVAIEDIAKIADQLRTIIFLSPDLKKAYVHVKQKLDSYEEQLEKSPEIQDYRLQVEEILNGIVPKIPEERRPNKRDSLVGLKKAQLRKTTWTPEQFSARDFVDGYHGLISNLQSVREDLERLKEIMSNERISEILGQNNGEREVRLPIMSLSTVQNNIDSLILRLEAA